MPTGYTCKVQTGEITKLEDYVLELTRGKDYMKIDTYHLDELNKAKLELDRFNNLSDEEILKEKNEYYINEKESNDKRLKKTLEDKANYLNMIDKVNKWNPDEEYSNLKQFALEQLNSSIEWDCDCLLKDIVDEKEELTIDEYKTIINKNLLWSIKYHSKEYAEEVENANKQHKYIDGLLKELEKIKKIDAR